MHPPKKAIQFLRWFCREDYIDEIEGDLTEIFRKKLAQSPQRARWLFCFTVLKYFRPEFIKSFRYQHSNSSGMYRNYLKVALRNIVKNNGYSSINIAGIALGMTITMLIGLWIYDELSFNKYHSNYERIGQIWAGGKDPEASDISGSEALQFPMGAVLKNNYSHYFKHVLMAWWVGGYTLTVDDKKLSKTGEFIDPAVIDMLSLRMISGSAASLQDRNSIILSRSCAEALFGNEDPLNQTVTIDNQMEVKVTGVYENIPKNNRFSEVQFFSPWELWVSMNGWIKESENNWDNRSFNIYVELQPGITMDEANAGIHDFYYKNVPSDFLKEIERYKPFAQVVPMSTWHLYSEFKNGKPAEGRITFVWLFGIVGFFVLLLACINFINLSTARSERRSREVGVRKSVGSSKSQLVFQFLSESFLVVIIAFVLSLVMLIAAQEPFNQLADKDISLPFNRPEFWIIMIGFVVLTGFLAGLYPAFYLSSFQPVKVLKGTMRTGRFSSLPRKVLVVIQFTVSVNLIIGTIVVYQQIGHARNRPIGYDRSGLLTLPMRDPNFAGKHEVLKHELLNTGVISNISFSSVPLTAAWNNSGGFQWPGWDPDKDNDFAIIRVGPDFAKTVGWEFISGRDFSKDLASDKLAVIINETAAKYMRLENPLDVLITHEQEPVNWKIVGVIKDMVMDSPYHPAKQTLFFFDPTYRETAQMQMRLKPTVSAVAALGKIQDVFEELVPTASFDFKFVDEEYAMKFSQEQRIGKLAAIFAGLAIFISCLGLFGLASFVAERRTKEIGIRKVMGASVTNLWQMLSKDFVVLVIISCLFAVPLSYYVMNEWLKAFQYRTEISPWIFLLTAMGALLITLITVSSQAVRAALTNPVNSLRSE
jgi:putative ABC transport system permease protein